MLIYKNNQEVDTKDKESLTAKEVLSYKQKLIDEYGQFPVFLEYLPGMITADRSNHGKYNVPSYLLPFKAKVKEKGGQVTWQISDNPPDVDKNGKVTFEKSSELFDGRMRIDEFDFVKAVYYRFFSSLCADNDLPCPNKVFRFINEGKNDRLMEEYKKKKLSVDKILYSDDDRILSKEMLKHICNYLDIANPTTCEKPTLRRKINDKIEEMEKTSKNSGYDQFLEICAVDENVVLKGQVNEMILKNIVIIKQGAVNKILSVVTNGETREIRKVPLRSNERDVLFEVLKANDELRIELVERLKAV